MANRIPHHFLEAPNTIVNIDFLDVATGVGYKRFYLRGTNTDAGGDLFELTTNETSGSDIENYRFTSVSDDENFDVTFTKPLKMATNDLEIWGTTRIVGSASQTYTVTITVYHVDVAASATSLGSIAWTSTHDGTPKYRKRAAKIAVSEKIFKKGEKLRVRVQTSGSASSSEFYFDPVGRRTATETDSSATIDTKSWIAIPIQVL